MSKKTTTISVTLEKTIRVYKTFEATDEDLRRIEEDGENPFFDEMEKICTEENGEVEYNYAVENEDTGKTLVDWD